MRLITLTHTIDAAHRVVGHTAADGSPGKCSRLHGHTYRFDVAVMADVLDHVGFVIDFAALKAKLDEWDHRCLLWADDPLLLRNPRMGGEGEDYFGVVRLPFNPTSELMAEHLAKQLYMLDPERIAYVSIDVAETAKTKASSTYGRTDYEIEQRAALGEPIVHDHPELPRRDSADLDIEPREADRREDMDAIEYATDRPVAPPTHVDAGDRRDVSSWGDRSWQEPL